MTDPMEHNRALWDEWTRIHVTAEFYDAQSFRDGTRTNRLRPDPNAPVATETEYAWNHSLGEIVTAIAGSGLRIESLREYPFLEWPLDFLEERDDGIWTLPADQDGKLPLYFSLKATKPA